MQRRAGMAPGEINRGSHGSVTVPGADEMDTIYPGIRRKLCRRGSFLPGFNPMIRTRSLGGCLERLKT